MLNSINSLTKASSGQSGSVSLPMQELFPLEQNTSAVANRCFQENPLSLSHTPLRNVVHLSDGKKAGAIGPALVIFFILAGIALSSLLVALIGLSSCGGSSSRR